ncbi:hypothetical protein GWN42_05845, partial [candidate division KSB1 bacterium]|nr:hypothetical protein [candidate division KSB1 bacterium]
MFLAAHQPAYLPDLTFFYKMSVADMFVLADTLQFSKHGAINRAKIKTARGINWLTVPVLTKGREGQSIAEVEINGAQAWQHKHWKTLVVNYTYAAYFEKYADFFANLYEKP